jgi:voltage-gated potassium channel
MNGKVKFIYEVEGHKKSFPGIRRVVEHHAFGLSIVFLILLSVVLILVETFMVLKPDHLQAITTVNDILTTIFIFELTLRWLISETTKKFLTTYWIDILAVLPMLRIFRLGRVLRLLRLFRIFSLGAVFQRRFATFNRVLEGRYVEYGIISGFTLFAVIFGAVGLSQFESGVSPDIVTRSDAFWKSLFSLLSGEYADYPQTIGGKMVFLVLLIFEMGVFAMLTGTFSAIMIEKLKESAMHKASNTDELKGHIIICGFSNKAAILSTEFLIDPAFKNSEILIVSEKANLTDLVARGIKTERISILKEDFTRVETLKKAGVEHAVAAIILSERGKNRSTQDIDARTLLAALTIEKINPKIHTSAEIYHEEYAEHLKMGGVEDVVLQGEVSGKLLARVAMHEGLLAFFKDLLSRESGNTLTFIEPPEELIGLNIDKAMGLLHNQIGFIVVGVKPKDTDLLVNPKQHTVQETDQLLVINPVTSG